MKFRMRINNSFVWNWITLVYFVNWIQDKKILYLDTVYNNSNLHNTNKWCLKIYKREKYMKFLKLKKPVSYNINFI